MFQVTVALPSGYSEKFSIEQSSTVGDLRRLAQKSFQRGFLRLVAADHHVLDPTSYTASARSGTRGRRPLHSYCPGGKASGSSKSFVTELSHGASQTLVVTAPTSELCSMVSSKFKLQMRHWLRSWQMGRSCLGATTTVAVTALKSKIN